MATPIVYVLCDQNCKFEGMTKEQIVSAIMQAVSTGRIADVDAGFVTKVKTVNGKYIQFFWGDQYEYDALSEEQKKDNLFAVITNETTKSGLLQFLQELGAAVETLIESKPATDLAVEKVGKICDENNNLTCKNQYKGAFSSDLVSGWYGLKYIEGAETKSAIIYIKAPNEITDTAEEFISTTFLYTKFLSDREIDVFFRVYNSNGEWIGEIGRFFEGSWEAAELVSYQTYELQLLFAE